MRAGPRDAEEERKLPRTNMMVRGPTTPTEYYRLPLLRTEENRCPYYDAYQWRDAYKTLTAEDSWAFGSGRR